MHNRTILQGLNEAQLEAVLHGEGPALVAAGPGSGKTRCITHRLLYLILEHQIPPQEILVITFTKEAAKTMQERFQCEYHGLKVNCKLNCKLNSQGFVSFGTFHSFFYQIIRSIQKYSEYQLITQQEKLKIAKEVLQKNDSEEVTETDIHSFLSCVSYFKNTGALLRYSSNITSQNENEQKLQFHEKFTSYEAMKQHYKRMDFDDMLYLCRKEFQQSEELLKYWQNRFTYILVDEAQDMNPVQYELLKMLTKSPCNLFLVGDDDQAIYGFRGSKTDIFQEFIKDYPNAIQICLSKNYRCAEDIVQASKRLIEGNQHRVEKKLVSAKENAFKGQIKAYSSVNTIESYKKVIEGLKNRQEEELDGRAVLFRTNFAMQAFATQLAVQNIHFVLREKIGSIYEHFVIKDILDYFRAASGERDRSLFIRIFQKLSVPLGREALRTGQVDLKNVKKVYSSGFYENRHAYDVIEILERNLNHLSKMRPALGIKYILHAMEYQKFLLHKCGRRTELLEEWQQLIDWLTEDAKEYADFKGWERHMQNYAKELEKQLKHTRQEKKGIHLLTLHASKGLEFKKVYIMNLNEGNIPQLRRGETITQERLEEERRLFYVGMTRAEEELELHYITGTKENPKIKSRFLEELKLARDNIFEEK